MIVGRNKIEKIRVDSRTDTIVLIHFHPT